MRTITNGFGQGVPEGGALSGLVLGSEWWREEACFRGMETVGDAWQ